MINSKELSIKRITWIREQGYLGHTDQQIRELAFGNRFAYRLCVTFLTPAVIFANVPILVFMNVVAFSSILLPNHPFDYIYNYLVRRWMNGPLLPPRSPQLKFACMLASVVIASTIYFIVEGMMTAAYLMGGQMIVIASIVSLFDLCFPSKIYNYIAGKVNQQYHQ